MVPSAAPMPLVAERENAHVVLRLIQPHAVVLVMRKKSNNADLQSVPKDNQRVKIIFVITEAKFENAQSQKAIQI